MDKQKNFIDTHPLVGWDISTEENYDALMIRLHSVSSQTPISAEAETEIGLTYWLTTDVARQLITILEAGIAKVEATSSLVFPSRH